MFSPFFSGNIFHSLHVCVAFIGLGRLSGHPRPIGDIGNAFIYIPRIWSSPQHNSHPLGIGDPQSRPFISEKGPILRETSFGNVDGKSRELEETFTAPMHKGLFPEQSHPPAPRCQTRPDITYSLTPVTHRYSGSFLLTPTFHFFSLRALRSLLGPTCACHMSHFKKAPL